MVCKDENKHSPILFEKIIKPAGGQPKADLQLCHIGIDLQYIKI